MKKIFLAALAASVAFTLTGCKGANEKRGDEHLQNGRFKNAINQYLDAQDKGKISDEFYDNFTLALVRAANAESKNNINSDLINGYFDKAASNISKVNKIEVIEEYAKSYAEIARQQIAVQDVDYGSVLQAFSKIDMALEVVKDKIAYVDSMASAGQNAGIDKADLLKIEGDLKAIRTQSEENYVPRALAEVKDEEDPVVYEYYLLRIAEVAPENAALQDALNKSRKSTRGYFLIFGENIPDQTGKSRVDKYGYVLAFPTIKITATSLSGELLVWASTGNNTVLDPEKITLVSTDGKSVVAKAGAGWCEAEVIVGKKEKAKVEKKRQNLKAGEKGKLMNEFQCGLNVSFSFEKGFKPDYVQYKDEFGIGKKFLGQ